MSRGEGQEGSKCFVLFSIHPFVKQATFKEMKSRHKRLRPIFTLDGIEFILEWKIRIFRVFLSFCLSSTP